MRKKYIVRLTEEEHSQLRELISTGKSAAYRIKHANILLKADANTDNWSDEQIAVSFDCHSQTVHGIRKRFVLEGLESALSRKKQANPSRARVLDGDAEAQLIALSLTEAPKGFSSWSLRLLSEKLVELEVVEAISHETVRTTLKKMRSNHT